MSTGWLQIGTSVNRKVTPNINVATAQEDNTMLLVKVEPELLSLESKAVTMRPSHLHRFITLILTTYCPRGLPLMGKIVWR